jgi:hypothetical protein
MNNQRRIGTLLARCVPGFAERIVVVISVLEGPGNLR